MSCHRPTTRPSDDGAGPAGHASHDTESHDTESNDPHDGGATATVEHPGRRGRGQKGQTLPLVLGVCLILTLGSVVLVQNTFQQYPIVTKNVVQHEAYRAMLAGVDEYLYELNSNANYASCFAKYYTNGGALVGSAPSSFSSSTLCSGITFNTWISVPGTAAVNGPPMWFYLSTPNVNTSNGNLTISVIGGAGYPNTYNYQTAQIVLQPLNSFLLNVLWMDKNQIDPALLNFPTGDTCPYYWVNGSLATYGGGHNAISCVAVDFATADVLTGNLFTNDSIFVCGSPTFKTAYTADPNEAFVSDCNGSTATITGHGSQYMQTLPTDDSALDTVATSGGCLYEGPTTIKLNGTTMNVTSPNTPTGKPVGAPGSSVANDSLIAAANTTNVCMPSSPGGSVSMPTNGVIYVEDCVNPATCTTASPLANTGSVVVGEEGVSTNVQNSVGDAIVQGSVTNPLTIGTSDNIDIDGNLCYTDDVSGSPSTCTTGPTSPSTNVLGLVADNYVEINHPVDNNGNDVSNCPAGLGNGTPTCDLPSPIVDAVILALGGSFLVNQWDQGAPLGTLTLNGTIDQAWRGAVATANNGNIVTGYAKNYVYDPRLTYLSPPYYLNPGTSQWGFASFTDVSGGCKVPTGQTCPTGYP